MLLAEILEDRVEVPLSNVSGFLLQEPRFVIGPPKCPIGDPLEEADIRDIDLDYVVCVYEAVDECLKELVLLVAVIELRVLFECSFHGTDLADALGLSMLWVGVSEDGLLVVASDRLLVLDEFEDIEGLPGCAMLEPEGHWSNK